MKGGGQEGGTECLRASLSTLMTGLINIFSDDMVPNSANML